LPPRPPVAAAHTSHPLVLVLDVATFGWDFSSAVEAQNEWQPLARPSTGSSV
jgi:hypothetical protein